jgi:hypothetical protein
VKAPDLRRRGLDSTGAVSRDRDGKAHFYYDCTTRGHKNKAGCDAPYIPAVAIDTVFLQRCVELSGNERARDRIVSDSLKYASAEDGRLVHEIDQVRRREARTQVQIANLVSVLKEMGRPGIASVKDELNRLEEERAGLEREHERLASARSMLIDLTEVQRKFLENWQGLADLLTLAAPEEIRRVLAGITWTS